MILDELNPPLTELPELQVWYRIQLLRAKKNSVRANGHILAPAGVLANRFDLPNQVASYLGDSPETALYEAIFRRKIFSYHMDDLRKRALVAFQVRQPIQLVDMRGLEERNPVLQAERYGITQGFALECWQRGLDGVHYASAQHPRHDCICLFPSGIAKTRRLSVTPLVEPITQALHKSVVTAAWGSQVPIVPSDKAT